MACPLLQVSVLTRRLEQTERLVEEAIDARQQVRAGLPACLPHLYFGTPYAMRS